MACDVFDALRLPTEHLDKTLYRRASIQSIWLNMIPKSEYVDGVGLINSTFTIERSEPTSSEQTWAAIQTAGATSQGSCKESFNDVNFGYTERKYSPESYDLRGPPICKNELIFNFQAERFLEAYIHALTINSQHTIENRYENIFMHLSQKNVCNTNYDHYDSGALNAVTLIAPSGPDLTGVNPPTMQLEQAMLDITAAELNRDGANNPNSPDWITLGDDGPVYPLLIGQEMSAQLKLASAELRKDYRYAEPSLLLKRMGATYSLKNFRHIITLTPPRWNYTNGAYVRVNTWVMVPASKGYKAVISNDYKHAAIEGAIVLNPWVFHSEVIRPKNAAGDMSWKPETYFGEWMWRTGARNIMEDISTCTNYAYDPLEEIGRHFAKYKHAARPIFPEFGRLILYNRCPTASFAGTACS